MAGRELFGVDAVVDQADAVARHIVDPLEVGGDALREGDNQLAVVAALTLQQRVKASITRQKRHQQS